MEKRTELSSVGEFGLIDIIKKGIVFQNPSTRVGIGDDAAVIDVGNDVLVVSKDLLAEGIHFDLSFMPLRHVGYKAVVVNISDVAAMNAVPKQILAAIALSNRFSLEAIEELYKGIRAACADYKVDLVGGDTTSSTSGLVISITAIGVAKKGNEVLRSTAQKNDILCVTGDLGGAFTGLKVMQREKEVFLTNPKMQPQLEEYEYVVGRLLKPKARMDIIYELEEMGVKPTSMIDISDGLSSEVLHISKASNLGAKLFEDKIPIDPQTILAAHEMRLDPVICALHGGDEYELLFTISPHDFEKIKNHSDIHLIGHLHDNPQQNLLITKGGNAVPLVAQGWKHF